MLDFLKGKKTFLVSVATIVFAVSGAVTNQFDWSHALQLILGALGMAALRDGIKTGTGK